MKKEKYPPNYSHFGTVCIPVLNSDLSVRHYTTVLLRTLDTDSKVHVFYSHQRVHNLSAEEAKNLKRGLKDSYIDTHGEFHPSGYNQLNGRVKRR